jgi:hypothetical protein
MLLREEENRDHLNHTDRQCVLMVQPPELCVPAVVPSMHTPIRSIVVACYFSNARIEDIEWDAPQHSLIIQGVTIKLTKTEYRLLYPLRHGLPLTYEELARIVYNCATDKHTRMMIDKHIDRIRGKLRDSGIYVYCILGYGYLLFNDNSEKEE